MVAALLVTLAAAPFWLPLAAKPVARRFGVEFARYERVGFSGMILHDARFQRNRVTITAARVQTDAPITWAWRHWFGSGSRVAVEKWAVVVAPRPSGQPAGSSSASPAAGANSPSPAPDAAPAAVPARSASRPFGMPELHAQLSRIAPLLDRWLPHAEVRDGSVTWGKGGLTLKEAAWEKRALKFSGLELYKQVIAGGADFSEAGRIRANAGTKDFGARLDWTATEASGEVTAYKQSARAEAKFRDGSWLPDTATAEAAAFELDAALLRLDRQYGSVRGTARATWAQGAFEVVSDVSAAPLPTAGPIPPLELAIEARGDRASWTLAKLRITAPFATAILGAPIVAGYDGRSRSGPARLTFEGDLSRQAWVPLRGRGAGRIDVTGGAGEPFRATLTGDFNDIAWRERAVGRVTTETTLDWPRVNVVRLEIALSENSSVRAAGVYDIKARTVSGATASGSVTAASLQRMLGGAAAARIAATGTTIAFEASAAGPIAALEHRGELKTGEISLAPMKPVALSASWTGRGPAIANASVTAVANGTRLQATGSGDAKGARVTALTITPQAPAAPLELRAPVAIAWSPVLSISQLNLAGGPSRLAIDLKAGADPSVKMDIAGFDSQLLDDFVTLPGPKWAIQSLLFSGALVGGKPTFAANGDASVQLEPFPARIRFIARGSENELRLDNLTVSDRDQILAAANGWFPVAWDTEKQSFQVNPNGTLEINASTNVASPMWTSLGRSFGLDLENPRASIKVSGTPRNPLGDVNVGVERLAFGTQPGSAPLPVLENVSLVAHAYRGLVTLDELSANVDGQPVKASGRLPMVDADWRRLFRERAAPKWEDAEATIDIAEAEIAPLARYAPRIVATQGKLEAHVGYAKGVLTGTLKLRDAATRPIPSVGIVQEITADIALKDRTVEVRSIEGRLGGQPVTVEGTVGLEDFRQPKFAMKLKTADVPLVRRSGTLVRANVDLTVDTNETGTTKVGGVVTVTDALILQDLRDLLPTGARAVSRPPPYFSVNVPPIDKWQLAVDLRAPDAIRIRSALFNGVASANFDLVGTLADPRATGEVSITSGQVMFPFVTFEVQLGSVRLTAGNPYHPELNINATARRYGYDLRMEATGPADDPVVRFSANPALGQEQIIFMVAGGQAPTRDQPASATNRLGSLGAYVGQNLLQEMGASGDRLDIGSGEEISEKGRETYRIDYRVNEKVSVVGEYDEFDDFNAGVKWKIFSR